MRFERPQVYIERVIRRKYVSQCDWFPSRSTINDMLHHSVTTIQPLVDQLWHQVLQPAIVLADETRVLLLTRQSTIGPGSQTRVNGWTGRQPPGDLPELCRFVQFCGLCRR